MAKSRFTRKSRGAPAAGASGGQTVAVDTPEPKKPRISPIQFFGQVRAEGRKITWPSRKETWITSVMVFIMVALAAGFFFVVDFVLNFGLGRILALGQ